MPADRTSDRRQRSTFWIDDAILDTYAPLMARFPFGSAAVAVYCALARRADRDGESWPALRSLASMAATSESTCRRALRLLELYGLVEIVVAHDAASGRQTSNRYVLLTPPAVPPDVPDDPNDWPPAVRAVILLGPDRRPIAPDAVAATPCQADTLPPCQADTLPLSAGNPPPVSLIPLMKDTSIKDTSEKEHGAPALLTDERPTTTTTDDDAARAAAPAGTTTTTTTTDDDDDGRRTTTMERARLALLDLAAADPDRPPFASPARWADHLAAADANLITRLYRKALKEARRAAV